MRRFFFSVLAIFLASLATADPLDDAIALFRRQLSNATTTTSDPSTTTITFTSESTETSLTDETSSIIITPSQSASASTVFSTSTLTPTTFTSLTSETSTEAPSEKASTETEAATSLTEITTSYTVQFTTVYTTTSDGSTFVATRTSSTVVPTTTEVDPTTLSNKSGSGSSGLSSTAKATIGGVVGGVGGALLLAGLAYTAWRVWGKKKNLHDDDLYDPNVTQDKLSTNSANDPTPHRRANPRDSEQCTPVIINKIPFAFENRARSSSPSAKISTHIKDNREKRKICFLEGIRGRRQGQKDERLGDQVLRMDYIRELKAWEQQKAAEEMAGQTQPDDEDVDMVEELRQAEEQEIEQLVSYLEDKNDPFDRSSDDEYDQLFTELSTSHTDMAELMM
ncbi:hypothetical protein DV737_g4739, partial [Chaetothyriales sp. CBS 132003]